ncbi:hypothetical protein JCM8547_008921 [Rhodosporidiobolus lusitaniae]
MTPPPRRMQAIRRAASSAAKVAVLCGSNVGKTAASVNWTVVGTVAATSVATGVFGGAGSFLGHKAAEYVWEKSKAMWSARQARRAKEAAARQVIERRMTQHPIPSGSPCVMYVASIVQILIGIGLVCSSPIRLTPFHFLAAPDNLIKFSSTPNLNTQISPSFSFPPFLSPFRKTSRSHPSLHPLTSSHHMSMTRITGHRP